MKCKSLFCPLGEVQPIKQYISSQKHVGQIFDFAVIMRYYLLHTTRIENVLMNVAISGILHVGERHKVVEIRPTNNI